MKNALVLRGLARFIDEKVETFRGAFGEDTDIYICTWDESGVRGGGANECDYSTKKIDVDKLVKLFNPIKNKSILVK